MWEARKQCLASLEEHILTSFAMPWGARFEAAAARLGREGEVGSKADFAWAESEVDQSERR
jgi:hypothetical protein